MLHLWKLSADFKKRIDRIRYLQRKRLYFEKEHNLLNPLFESVDNSPVKNYLFLHQDLIQGYWTLLEQGFS